MVPILKTVNKFTTTIKSVNKLGLGAMAIIAIAMMSFKAPAKNATAQKYGWDQEHEEWVLIQDLTMDNSNTPAPNTYRCELSSSKCSGVFNTPPTDVNDIPDSQAISGDFSLN